MLIDNALLNDIAIAYEKASKADYTIFCFPYQKNVYAIQIQSNSDFLVAVSFLEKYGDDIRLRYRPNKAQKQLLFLNAIRTEILCSVEMLETLNAQNAKRNRGDIVEKLACEMWNGLQPKNRAMKFCDCGDFSVDGVEFQVKYEKATITTLDTLKNLGLL